MRVWYLGQTSIRESYPDFEICNTCSFSFLNFECCQNKVFDNIHPCCSVRKHYRKITKSDIFNL